VLQDDDEIRVFLTGNKGFGKLHFNGTVNFTTGVGDEDDLGDSDRIFWHLHADYVLTDWFVPALELNGYYTTNEGDEVLPFTGVDVANLGGGEGEDVITIGTGAAFRINERLSIRTAFETPLTSNEDIFDYRFTSSAVIRF